MKIQFSKRFLKEYQRLPAQIQESVDKQIKLLSSTPEHPSLDLKKMQDPRDIWRIKVTRGYRITLQVEPDSYFLRRVGSHDIEKNP